MFLHVESCDNVREFINHTKCNPVAFENGFLVTVQHSSLMLWPGDQKVVLETEHRYPISTLCASSSPNPYLCSCSDDKVILWSFEDFREKKSGVEGTSSTGLLVGVDLGSISDCSISCDNTWLALCRESDVWVVRLQHSRGVLSAVSHHATLEPAGDSPSFCCFSPILPDLLITADDSNTFKVWNVASGRAIQRAAVGGWHRVSLCEFVPRGSRRGQLMVGSNRGVLHLFSVSLDKPPRSLGQVFAAPPAHATSVLVAPPEPQERANAQTVIRRESDYCDERLSGPSPAVPPGGPGPGEDCEAGCVVLSALLLDAALEAPEDEADAAASEAQLQRLEEDPTVASILAPAPLLVLCSNQGVALYDCHSWDCLDFRPYAELLGQEASLVTTAALTAGPSPGRVRCLVGALVGCGACTLLVRLACAPARAPPASSTEDGGSESHCRQPRISFLAFSALSARSPLRAQFSRPAVDAVAAAYGSKAKPPPRKGGAAGSAAPAPRPARSSGYGPAATGQRQRFVPVTNQPRPRPACALPGPTDVAGRPGGGGGGGLLSRLDAELMRTWTPPMRQCGRASLWHDFGTAVRLASSGDGRSLACACGPGVLSVLRWSRPSVDDAVRIAGHDARVTSVCFSADSSWLMSASSDGRTKVWDWRERRCVLDIGDGDAGPKQRRGLGRQQGLVGAKGEGESAGRGPGVAQAAFFYLDRFILRAVAGAVELYCHRLHDEPPVAAKPGFGGPRGWRRVRKIQFPTQQVTCFAAPNSFFSNLLVAGCASRSLHVYDVDAERLVAEVRDAHPRPPHALVLATASAANPQAARAADLMVSAAACDGAKLWDLRQARCVRKFSKHLNRAHACGVALSPCCRYLAVGSEDKSVYLYDTRSSDYVDKLLGMNEVVLDVTWNPMRPMLAASALNSCVSVFGNT